jgi:hypothetical protein
MIVINHLVIIDTPCFFTIKQVFVSAAGLLLVSARRLWPARCSLAADGQKAPGAPEV